jgi:hypothetical protein
MGERPRKGVEIAEQFADGKAPLWRLLLTGHVIEKHWHQQLNYSDFLSSYVMAPALCDLWRWYQRLWSLTDHRPDQDEFVCSLVRDIFGNPFRPQAPLHPSVRAWNGGIVNLLAKAIYEERSLPTGTLDVQRLGVLADALEDAGSADAELLTHLRSQGTHVRGCWALDAILARR